MKQIPREFFAINLIKYIVFQTQKKNLLFSLANYDIIKYFYYKVKAKIFNIYC